MAMPTVTIGMTRERGEGGGRGRGRESNGKNKQRGLPDTTLYGTHLWSVSSSTRKRTVLAETAYIRIQHNTTQYSTRHTLYNDLQPQESRVYLDE